MTPSTRTSILLSAGLAAALVLAPIEARAQASATITPGMSREDVVRVLGTPTGERSSRGYTYLFFANGCERTCGTSDVVTLEDGVVSGALLRKPGRHYTGGRAAAAPAASVAGQPDVLRVAARRPAARRGARTARSSRAGTTGGRAAAAGAASTVGQTPALVVQPRRAQPASGAVAGANGAVPPRALADTTTSTGTRFGPPLTVVPGPATPQTPGLGAPPSQDSTVRNGVQLPPGSVPVPFQGARPSSVDSARLANDRARAPQPTTPPARPR